VQKRETDQIRLCVNYKRLNAATVFDPEPMLETENILLKLAGAAQIVAKVTMQYLWLKTARITLHLYVTKVNLDSNFKVMSFGLVNSGATYSGLQKIVLDGAKSIDNFVDDVICATPKFEESLRLIHSHKVS